MKRSDFKGSRWIVTGATSGIGRALAIELARAGAAVLASGRRVERLERLCSEIAKSGGQCETLPGDIAEEKTRQSLVAWADRRWQGLDGLVNCAGVGAMGRFDQATPDRLRQIFEVNFFAAVELTRACLPLLSRGQRPIIVNIGSVLGHCAVPLKSEYCASKFALHGFSDALRVELRPVGIDVLLVSPSTTDSEFFDSALEDQTRKNWKGTRAMSPEVVAKKTIAAIRGGRREIILSTGGKFLVWADRLCPSLVNRLLARFAQ